MEASRKRALKLGASDFGKSTRKDKKYFVVYRGKMIHFGHSGYADYTTHKDPERRRRYLARATKIVNGQGELTAKDKTSANFWAIKILW